jgi:hypothetical protein
MNQKSGVRDQVSVGVESNGCAKAASGAATIGRVRRSSLTLEPFIGEDHHGDNQGDPKEYEEHNSE